MKEKRTYSLEKISLSEAPKVMTLYQHAREYQKKKGAVIWPLFSQNSVEDEIRVGRLWKIAVEGQMAAVWSIAFEDPWIWEEENQDPALYLHKIAIHPNYRGHQFVPKIVAWAKEYAKDQAKHLIRMDTVGNNESLIAYYQKCGFKFLGFRELKQPERLPAHYHKAPTCLFEMDLSSSSK